MPTKLIPANLDPKIKIKESDKGSYHVEFTKLIADPDLGPSRPQEFKDISVYLPKVWKTVKRDIDELGIQITGYQEHRVVHDPERDGEIGANDNAEKIAKMNRIDELLKEGKLDEAKELRDGLSGPAKTAATKKINASEKQKEPSNT